MIGGFKGLVNFVDGFKGHVNFVDLSVELVQTNRHILYDMVYTLLKLVLLLPVVTASVESKGNLCNGFSQNKEKK